MEFLSIPDQAVPFRTVQCQPDHRHQPIIGIVPVEDQEPTGRVAPDPFQIQQGILGIGGHFGERFHFFQYPFQFSQFFPAAAGFRCFPVPEGLLGRYQVSLGIRHIFLFQAFQSLGRKSPSLFPHGFIHLLSILP